MYSADFQIHQINPFPFFLTHVNYCQFSIGDVFIREADLSDLSDSWRDMYSANFQINRINPFLFFLTQREFDEFHQPVYY